MTNDQAEEWIRRSPGRNMHKVQSFSRQGEYHLVWKRLTGEWDCSCEFKQIYRSKKCDHIRKVQKLKLKYKHRMKHDKQKSDL